MLHAMAHAGSCTAAQVPSPCTGSPAHSVTTSQNDGYHCEVISEAKARQDAGSSLVQDLAPHSVCCLRGSHPSMARAGGRRKDRARAKYELQHIARTLTTDQKVGFQGAGRGSARP